MNHRDVRNAGEPGNNREEAITISTAVSTEIPVTTTDNYCKKLKEGEHLLSFLFTLYKIL
jgi:hypothetical protein